MQDIQLLKEMTESQRQFVYFGMKLEQERIIKVIDRYLGEVDYDDLIALIKGEQK